MAPPTPSTEETEEGDQKSSAVQFGDLDIDALVIEGGFKATEGNIVANMTSPNQKNQVIEWCPGTSWKLDATIQSKDFEPSMLLPGHDPKLVRINPGGNKAIVGIGDISILNVEHPKYPLVKMSLQVSLDITAFPPSMRSELLLQYDKQLKNLEKLCPKAKSLLVSEILADPKKVPAFKEWAKTIKKTNSFNSNMSDEELVKKPETKAFLDKTIEGIPMNAFFGSYTSSSGQELNTVKFKVTYVKKHGGFSGVVKMTKTDQMTSLVKYFQKPKRTKIKVFSYGISLWLTNTSPNLSVGFKCAEVVELKSSSMTMPVPSKRSLSMEDPENDADGTTPSKQQRTNVIEGDIEQFIYKYLLMNSTPILPTELAKALNLPLIDIQLHIDNLIDAMKLHQEEDERLVAIH